MKHPKTIALLLLVSTFGLCALAVSAQTPKGLGEAIRLFRDGQYDKAIPVLHAIIGDPAAAAQKPDAYLLMAKSYMALGKLDLADKSIEFYLANFTGAPDYAEALYQKGRLLFLQEQYEQSIQVLQQFITTYSGSPLVSNAWFWVAESLYNLGHVDDAEKVYQKILTDFPTSVKVEAAQYKISLIQLQKRQIELGKLLKWSHEDFLRSLEEFQRREKTYEQAIEVYQRKLAGGTADQDQRTIADLRAELAKKTAEAQNLAAKLAQLGLTQPAVSPPPAAPGVGAASEAGQAALSDRLAEIERRERLLAIKEQALDLKEKYLAAQEGSEAAK
ncbi:MAG TPA: tetratricopeptide repeat protein [Spirochaetia bacterium]|nr:tetratricopeptide repeat protein [Spirochaetia bacterium]